MVAKVDNQKINNVNFNVVKLTSADQNPISKPQIEAEKAARDFESLLVKQLISEMWQAVPKEGIFEGGRAEETYYDMYHQSLADSIASGKGIGIKEELLPELLNDVAKRYKSSSDLNQ